MWGSVQLAAQVPSASWNSTLGGILVTLPAGASPSQPSTWLKRMQVNALVFTVLGDTTGILFAPYADVGTSADDDRIFSAYPYFAA